MACFATTWSPNSFQLRLAFNSRTSPVSFVRIRVLKLDRPVRFFSVSCSNATSGNGKELSRVRDSWTDSNPSADVFAGWSGANGVERSNNSQRKLSLEGIMGGGLAGLILVAGVTFAALSFTRHSTSGKKQEMQTLTAQQQMALTSDDLIDRVEEDNNGDKNEMQGNNSLQSKTDTDNDYLHKEYNEATSGETDAEYISNDGDVIKNASVQQEDLENEATVDNISVAAGATGQLVEPKTSIDSFAASNLEDSKGSSVAVYPEFTAEVTEGFVDAKPTKSNFELNGEYQEGISSTAEMGNSNSMLGSSSNHTAHIRLEFPFDSSVNSPSDAAIGPFTVSVDVRETTSSISNKDPKPTIPEASDEGNKLSIEMHNLHKDVSSEKTSATHPYADGQDLKSYDDISGSETILYSTNPENFFTSVAIPAPTVIPADVQPFPGKVLVPAVVDQIQGQVLLALQVLKVIEADVQPGDLCTRREYACWLVSASSALSRNTVSKVYPAMYIESVTELAFDDITPEDPDFTSIQGLAEAGLISSKLSRRDMNLSNEDTGPICFFPESPLSRQDLVSWKMALEKRWLPEADRKTMQRLSGFIDIDKINQDAWPAILADLSAGEQGIIALAFGYTRLFQPHKPVTKAQAAVALATGEGSDIIGEELARIEAESMAEKAVAVHNALVAQVEKDLYASFEEELLLEREKIDAVGKLAEEARRELERLRTEREEETTTLMKERTAVDSEMDVLTKLRHEVEEQLQTLMSNQVEISYEKERVSKLQKDTELENQEIARLHYELEVERKALAMARAWAQNEAKRAREQAKALEEARDRWERHGIKVVVDNDLQEEGNAGVTWLTAGKEFSVEETVGRAENLVDKLKAMAADVRGKSRDIINKVIQKILFLVSELKGWTLNVGRLAEEQKDAAMLKISGSLQELQQSSAGYTMAIKEIAKRVAGDCKEGVDKLTQKFKS